MYKDWERYLNMAGGVLVGVAAVDDVVLVDQVVEVAGKQLAHHRSRHPLHVVDARHLKHSAHSYAIVVSVHKHASSQLKH